MRLTVPQFAADLVRDLRDRRLLPLALILLAGLIAVPVLLSRSAETPPAAPTAAALPDGATEAQPAVLAERVGIRDYRKRLEEFKSSNPFKQKFQVPDVSAGALDEAAALSDSSGSSGATSSGGSGGSTGGGGSAAGGGGSGSDSSSSTPAPKPEIRFTTRRVDVKVGPKGDLATRRNVRTLSALPSRKKPAVSYLGTNEVGDQAVFLVSGDVTEVITDARCMPSSSSCQFLVLEEGESARLKYGPDGQTYVLRLIGINSVLLSDGVNLPDKSGKRPPLAG